MTDASMPGTVRPRFRARDPARPPGHPRRDGVGLHAGPDELESARRLGVTEVVLKPHTSRELGAAMHRVMGTVRPAENTSSA